MLYASPSLEVCLAESIMRGRYHGIDASAPHMIDESDITERSVATLGLDEARPLRLADLTAPLWRFGFNAGVLSVPDYTVPNLWSLAIHNNVHGLDGIYFVSRYANAPSVAVFSDRAVLVPRGDSIPPARHRALPGFLDRYEIGIAPGGVDWRTPDA
ncbi:RES domain-containing protein [Trinickia dinghuensis]|uniref:RES domain-containing protein n=1 Tax=Trinickia dinghuensis TaxID=2291023 RepID=UPI001FED07AB|nr:RES domain-containing protein [Trinickia dinghuensis]